MGGRSLLQGIFLTQGSNPDLQHYRPILYHLSHQRSPMEHYSTLKRNELSSHRETWRKFKCWWLSDRNLSARGYTLWSQPHDILEKAKLRRQHRGGWWPGTGAGPRWVSTEDFQGRRTTPYDAVMDTRTTHSVQHQSEPCCELWTLGDDGVNVDATLV